MDKKLNLILSASGHLPSGTGDPEFEALYEKEIKPLVSALDKYPRINVVFHYSGVILYWIERRHPEFFMLLEDLLSRKQAEILGGGFYNPILSLLPMTDKIGQIEMLTTYLRKHFGKRPQGCWLPAMAWEQNLVGPLNSCGMNYTFLEDQRFSLAGVQSSEGGIYSPCLTEDQGKLITVFPVAVTAGRELLRGRPLEVLDKLPGKLPPGLECPVMVIPVGGESCFESPGGERAGIDGDVPDYEQFFGELSKADPRVEFTTSAKIFRNLRSLKKSYFPLTLTPEFNSGISGNHSRQFLANHPAADGIYTKMVYVHTLINNQLRGDKTRKRTAMEELWKAQDSGIFRPGYASSPGLLHSPVRKAAYHSLLEAEKITREKGRFKPSLSVFDFNLDGEGEYIFQDEKLNCYIKPRGAGIFELDYLPAAWNYLDTLTAGKGTGGILVCERRCTFADWLAPAETTPELIGADGIRGGRFCGNEEYETSETDRVRRRLTFTLRPDAELPFGEIEIEKTWQLKKSFLALEYVLRNTGTRGLRLVFCPQVDLSFPGEGEGFFRVMIQREEARENIEFKSALVVKDIKVLEFQDIKNEAVISLESSRGFDGRMFQIRTGLPGMEEYQSTCLMPLFPVSLEGGKTWKTAFSLKISS